MSTSSPNSHFDVICIGAGPTGLACAIEAKRAGLRPLVIDKGCLCNSLYHYPTNMLFFTTPERMEIGDLPMTTLGGKPTRLEALKYYRRAVDHYALETRLYEHVDRIDGHDGAFAVHTTSLPSAAVAHLLRGEDFRPFTHQESVHKEEGFDVRATGRLRGQSSESHEYHASKIIIATGYYDLPNYLGIPGEDLPFVSHYFTDPHPYWNEDVVVIGAKNSAAEAALELFRAGARVTLVHRGPTVGKSLKYWVKPDIENRIRAGEIRALFSHQVTRFTPGRVYIRNCAGGRDSSKGFREGADSAVPPGQPSGDTGFLGGRSVPAVAGFSSDKDDAHFSEGSAPESFSGGRSFSSGVQGSHISGASAPEDESPRGAFQTRPKASTPDHTARDGEQILHAVQVFALTGYHPDYDFLRRQGIRLNPDTLRPEGDPDTHETNIPGMYVAGVVVGGRLTSDIFIENGRFHGREIIAAITGKGRLHEPEPVAPPGE